MNEANLESNVQASQIGGNGGIGGNGARSQSGWLRRSVRHIARVIAYHVWRPVRDAWRTKRRTHPVRFFTFHRVTDVCRDGMTVDEQLFREQLEYVLQTHQVMSLEEALELLQNGTRLEQPVAVITFDDGYRSVFDRAFPIMTELGVPGACFLTTGLVGTEKRFPHDETNPASETLDVMGWEEITRLRMLGWSVGAHSMTHARLSQCDPNKAKDELAEPLVTLRATLGHNDIPLAFPFGGPSDYTEENVRTAREVGYIACFSNHGGENRPPADPYHLKRIDIGGCHDTLAWKTMVHGIALGGWRTAWDRMYGNGGKN